jgi:ribosomal protein L11 methyltransferase
VARWIEVSLATDGEAAEAIAQELQDYCHQGISIEQADIEVGVWDDGDVPPATRVIVRGYFLDDESASETQANIEKVLGYLNMMYPMPKPAFSYVNDEDWAEAWKVHYHPVKLGKRILIRPRWIEVKPDPDDLVISLDPGMAFGTGTHPTTQLCLEALEDLVQPGIDVLDLGCGSGILAIGAALLGARKILAVDIDPVAVDVTIENANENGVGDHITAQQGGLETVITSARRFDLVVVNILAKVIIPMCSQGLGQTVRPGGKAIFSGLIDTQVDEVEAALRTTGLTPTARRQIGDWMLVEAVRKVE